MSKKAQLLRYASRLSIDETENEFTASRRFNAFAGFLYGLTILVFSGLLLSDEKLQIENYVGGKAKFANSDYSFPTILLACSATTAAVSILQALSGIMYLCGDLPFSNWKWIKLLLVVAYTTCFSVLAKQSFTVDYYDYYYWILLGNAIYSGIIIVCDAMCYCCSNPGL